MVTIEMRYPEATNLAEYLTKAEAAILPRELSERAEPLAFDSTSELHFSLVIAGALDLSLEEAEKLKNDPNEQPRLYPLVYPVMEKVASIVERHIHDWNVASITLVGGSSAFLGMARVVQDKTGIPTHVPDHPLFVTPLGIALHDNLQ